MPVISKQRRRSRCNYFYKSNNSLIVLVTFYDHIQFRCYRNVLFVDRILAEILDSYLNRFHIIDSMRNKIVQLSVLTTRTLAQEQIPHNRLHLPVTSDKGLVNGLLSSQCEKATLPASASKSSNNFPMRTFPKASTYKSRRFAT